MIIDMTTVTFMGALVLLTVGAILLAYWLLNRSERSALAFAGAMTMEGAGVMLLAFHPAFGGAVAVPAAMLFAASVAMAWAGLRLLTGKRPGWSTLVIALAGIAIPQLFSVPPVDLPQRATGTFVAAAVYGAMAVAMFRWKGDEGWLSWALAAVFAVRSVILLSHGILIGPDDGRGILVMGMMHLVTPFCGVATALFLVLLFGQRREGHLRRAAETDALTGASSRGAFFADAERLVARSRRRNETLALLALDLDRFKTINDLHGHPLGDQVLRIFSTSVRGGLRPEDLFGRIGGEEFAILLPGCDEIAAMPVARRVGELFAGAAEVVDGKKIAATVSIGVSVGSGATLAELMSDADRALYRAKSEGRNRTVLWKTDHDSWDAVIDGGVVAISS